MQTQATQETIELLRSALKELESPKGSVAAGVQKLLRAARTLNDEDLRIWSEIQLGEQRYTRPLNRYVERLLVAVKDVGKGNNVTVEQLMADPDLEKALEQLDSLNLKMEVHYPLEEVAIKSEKSGGGYVSIGFLEERYADLVRTKQGNDGTLYKYNLHKHINHVRKAAHDRAAALYNRLAYTSAPVSSFDLLRSAVDDRLLDLEPELAERLMTAFRSVATESPEEWSQALTTCRRLIEGLADALYPPTEQMQGGRKLGKGQYVNRLWAYMDRAISSETNRELAKAHVDFLGSYLEKLHKVSNKGVHASVERIEAVKAVFHIYLLVADLLAYLDRQVQTPTPNIHSATLDEIESLLNINRSIAKEIIKLRVQHGHVTPELLGKLRGVGAKTLAKAQEVFSFEKVQ